jgi:hypothetical protein
MRALFVFLFLFFLPLFAFSSELEFTVPSEKKARLRFVESRMDGNERKNVLVALGEIPGGSLVKMVDLEPILFQWVLNDLGKIIQSTMPYFRLRVLSISEPNEISDELKQKILSQEFHVHIRDLNAATIVARIFSDSLPDGTEKIVGPFLWDEFNPKGTWAYSISKGLNMNSNLHLLNRAPTDILDFCPRYFSLDKNLKEKFWIALLNQVVKFESAFIPHTASDEGRYDPKSKGVISSGLTQISIRSSKQECYQIRGCSSVRSQGDLYHPNKNLGCAVAIMSCLAERDSCVSCKDGNWKGIARYWSTLRDPYEVKCDVCPGGKITVGKKPDILSALKVTANFCQ